MGVDPALSEFLWFGFKNARACLFAGLFFLAVFGVPREGILGIPRYDLLLLIALAIQAFMLWAKLETWDELKAITLFHVIGFGLEVFKTSDAIRSWSYPDFAYTKVFGVPLFSGFMYAAVGSYIIQSWRLFDLRIRHHPSYWMAGLVSGSSSGSPRTSARSSGSGAIRISWARGPRCTSASGARGRCW